MRLGKKIVILGQIRTFELPPAPLMYSLVKWQHIPYTPRGYVYTSDIIGRRLPSISSILYGGGLPLSLPLFRFFGEISTSSTSRKHVRRSMFCNMYVIPPVQLRGDQKFQKL